MKSRLYPNGKRHGCHLRSIVPMLAATLTGRRNGSKILSMKTKTSVSLSEELLRAIDAQPGSRSEFVEAAAWAYLARKTREDRYRKEVALLIENADWLNAETADAMAYQAEP